MNTTAAGVLFLAKDTGRCMLQLREGNKRFNHTWGFWGGIIEKGETPFECIQREVEEEIGVVPELQKLNPIDVYQSKDKKESIVEKDAENLPSFISKKIKSA